MSTDGQGSGGGILEGFRLVEGSAFVAAPLGGMTLAQLGADVIRFDQIGGGLDYQRWPLAADGQSLFWAGLNKGKRSIQVDIRSEQGRELVTALIAAAGALLTNFPARGWLDYERLRERRQDLLMVALSGNPDGSSEVDYTVNPATGFPWATGPRNLSEPLNSVLPSWDLVMGGLAVTGLLAADRRRNLTGEGQLIRLALSDVAFATVGNLGRIAEAAARRPGPAQGRQLPVRRLRPRLRHRRRAPRDGGRADRPPVARARGGHRDRAGVRQHRGGHRPGPRRPRPGATRPAT